MSQKSDRPNPYCHAHAPWRDHRRPFLGRALVTLAVAAASAVTSLRLLRSWHWEAGLCDLRQPCLIPDEELHSQPQLNQEHPDSDSVGEDLAVTLTIDDQFFQELRRDDADQDALRRLSDSSSEPVLAVLGNIRWLKSLNLHRGHEAGDQVILQMWRAWRDASAPARAFYLGGGEYLSVVEPADLTHGPALALHLTRAVEQACAALDTGRWGPALSTGWAHGRLSRDLLDAAEADLQRRNTVEVDLPRLVGYARCLAAGLPGRIHPFREPVEFYPRLGRLDYWQELGDAGLVHCLDPHSQIPRYELTPLGRAEAPWWADRWHHHAAEISRYLRLATEKPDDLG